jgi:hypothetical protein
MLEKMPYRPAATLSRKRSAVAMACPTMAPTHCAAMKGATPPGSIPANVGVIARAMVTAGLANDVEAVNQ